MDASANFCSRSVAATGRRHLRHRPVDANRLCYFIFLTQPVAVTGRRHLRPRPVDFVILFSYSTCGCHWSEESAPSPDGIVPLFFFINLRWHHVTRLTLTDCILLFSYSTVAVTGRRHLRPRPVDFVLSFSYSIEAVTGRRHLRPRPVDFGLLFSYSTVAVTSRRHLRPRPVDFVLLFSYSTVAATSRRHLRSRPVDFTLPC